MDVIGATGGLSCADELDAADALFCHQEIKKMGKHADYGEKVLRRASDTKNIELSREVVIVEYGKTKARIDAVIDGEIAVEIEARTDKQIRGAIVDLYSHRCKSMLLIVMQSHAGKKENLCEQCISVFEKLKVRKGSYEVVILEGDGDEEKKYLREDIKKVASALKALRSYKK